MKTYFYSMDRDCTLHLIEYHVTQVKYNGSLLWFAENTGTKICSVNYPHYRLYSCFKELSLNKIKKLHKTFKRDFCYENQDKLCE